MTTGLEYADKLQASYDLLWKALGFFDQEEIEQADIRDGWTPKGLLAHVAFWDDFQTRRMEAALSGASAATGVVWPALANDQRLAIDRERDWDEIVTESETARQRMIDFARGLDDAALATLYPEGERDLSLDKLLRHMVRHTREHTGDLYDYAGSLRRWSRTDLRAFLERQHSNFMDGVGGLTEDEMLTVPVCGVWATRDVLAHVLSWNEYAYTLLQHWPDPDPERLAPWAWEKGETIDDINDRLLARKADLDPIALCDGLVTYHRRMMKLFDGFSEEALSSQGRGWFGRQDRMTTLYFQVYAHEVEHALDLWTYQQARIS